MTKHCWVSLKKINEGPLIPWAWDWNPHVKIVFKLFGPHKSKLSKHFKNALICDMLLSPNLCVKEVEQPFNEQN